MKEEAWLVAHNKFMHDLNQIVYGSMLLKTIAFRDVDHVFKQRLGFSRLDGPINRPGSGSDRIANLLENFPYPDKLKQSEYVDLLSTMVEERADTIHCIENIDEEACTEYAKLVALRHEFDLFEENLCCQAFDQIKQPMRVEADKYNLAMLLCVQKTMPMIQGLIKTVDRIINRADEHAEVELLKIHATDEFGRECMLPSYPDVINFDQIPKDGVLSVPNVHITLGMDGHKPVSVLVCDRADTRHGVSVDYIFVLDPTGDSSWVVNVLEDISDLFEKREEVTASLLKESPGHNQKDKSAPMGIE